MPNHLHAILFFNKPEKADWQPNKFGSQSGTLGTVLRGFKASVKTYATINNIDFSWQERFHDHVIQNQREYVNIREYILNNRAQWLAQGDNDDKLHV